MLRRPRHRRAPARGFTLIEILVTIALILIGLVGMLGLQTRASGVELESYQRGQALTLVRDMAARVADSRSIASAYLANTLSSTDGSVFVGVTGSGTVDTGTCVNGASATEIATYQMCQWGKAIQGAAEGTSSGAMIGAHGCLIRNDTSASGAVADVYIVVVWKGVTAGKDPLGMASGEAATPASECASSVNFGTGLRRAVTMRVMVPTLG